MRGLIAEAWHVVREKFGVEMELEVELVGNGQFECKMVFCHELHEFHKSGSLLQRR